MAERLEDLLRACTVRVTGGPAPGAGFFVAPGKVLTCAHVIGDSTALQVCWERDGQRPREARVYGPVAVLSNGGRPTRRTIGVGAILIAALVVIASQLVRSSHEVELGSLSRPTSSRPAAAPPGSAMASRPAVTPVATPGLPLETFRVPVTALKWPLTEIFSHSRMASSRTVTGFEFRNSAISNVCLTAQNTGPKAGKNKDLIDISVCQRTPNQIWIPVQWEADGSKFTCTGP